jgi:hypothetical protein
MAAADEMAVTEFRHDCGESGCGQWMPLPPTHFVDARSARPRRPADRPHRVPGLTRSLTSGVAGALALTAVHELGRRRLENAPRMDQVAMRGLRRILPGEQRDPGRLHRLALAGDLVSNSLYYSVIAAPTRKATWMRAAVLGTAAGLCALLLPERLGLGAPENSEKRSNQVMTIGWYLAGAVAAALIATASSPHVDKASRRR